MGPERCTDQSNATTVLLQEFLINIINSLISPLLH